MNNVFWLLAGIPGSGKSTFAQNMMNHTPLSEINIKNQNIIWISSDNIRKEIFGSEEAIQNKELIFSIMKQRSIFYLNRGYDVIYDATNITSKIRLDILTSIKKIKCKKNCIVFRTPYKVCLERNRSRTRFVPENIILDMHSHWEEPSCEEGWDIIIDIEC